MKNTKEELIKNVKECGQALIDKAEEIVADYKLHTNLKITCYPTFEDKYPHIVVESEFIPETWAKRVNEENR